MGNNKNLYTIEEVEHLLKQRFTQKIANGLKSADKKAEIEFRLGRLVYRKNRRYFETSIAKNRFIRILELPNSKKNYWDEIKEFEFEEYSDKGKRIRMINGQVIEAIQKVHAKKSTLNLRKPYFDVRLAISTEKGFTPDLTKIKQYKKLDKHRYIFRKEFVEIVLTEFKSGKHWKRQVEVETSPQFTKQASTKYVVFALFQYLKLFIKNDNIKNV